ncbi:hypothetical protein QTP70_002879 [Hemibagrus guttatus]|uniref:Uncharacterized protein n=1 Tax=Hemibagrus guttatus TaxID=175788 RepID=A0AAE0QST9_9TELE|nr:hypothetical protein QTP70_002879 [Hemibagrus guttatus]
MYSPFSDSQCEYSSAIESSRGFSHSMDESADYLTLGATRTYTVTSTGSLQGIEIPNGHFTPPKAASTPQRSHVPSSVRHRPEISHGFSGPPGYEGVLFSTRSRMDLAFSMSLSPQNSVKTNTFPQGQAFTRRDSQALYPSLAQPGATHSTPKGTGNGGESWVAEASRQGTGYFLSMKPSEGQASLRR